MNTSNYSHDRELSPLIERKLAAETSVSFDIALRYRIAAVDAWAYAKRIGMELNTLVTFEFQKDLSNSDIDVARVRKVSRYCRVYAKNSGVKPVQIWSRHRGPNSDIETVAILTHIPEDKFDNFKSNAEGWKFEAISVRKVGSQRDLIVNGQKCNILEYLFRATDSATKVRLPNVVSELSGPIVGVRTFVSHKLRSYNRAMPSENQTV